MSTKLKDKYASLAEVLSQIGRKHDEIFLNALESVTDLDARMEINFAFCCERMNAIDYNSFDTRSGRRHALEHPYVQEMRSIYHALNKISKLTTCDAEMAVTKEYARDDLIARAINRMENVNTVAAAFKAENDIAGLQILVDKILKVADCKQFSEDWEDNERNWPYELIAYRVAKKIDYKINEIQDKIAKLISFKKYKNWMFEEKENNLLIKVLDLFKEFDDKAGAEKFGDALFFDHNNQCAYTFYKLAGNKAKLAQTCDRIITENYINGSGGVLHFLKENGENEVLARYFSKHAPGLEQFKGLLADCTP